MGNFQPCVLRDFTEHEIVLQNFEAVSAAANY